MWLFGIFIHDEQTNNIIKSFNTIIPQITKQHKHTILPNPIQRLSQLRDKYNHALWITIDKDTRRMTPICQHKYTTN